MNKLEESYAQYLDLQRATGEIRGWMFEPVTLRLAKATTYRPDFMVYTKEASIEFHETKGGFFRDDAKVKLKVAAEQYKRIFKFYLVRKRLVRDGGGWDIQEIVP